MVQAIGADKANEHAATGEILDMAGERYYAIRNVDKMAPFFISVVSNVDHWLFVLSTGGVTAGRVSPDTALFPYNTVDKILEGEARRRLGRRAGIVEVEAGAAREQRQQKRNENASNRCAK